MNGDFEFKFMDDPRSGREKGLLVINNCKTIFRNFAGAPTKFTDAGRREFSVLIDDELADILKEDGWNVKMYQDRNKEMDIPYIKIKVNYRDEKDEKKEALDPSVVVVKNNKEEKLNEHTVGMLDWATIENVDLLISPYHWNFNGSSGVSGYLKAAKITLAVDELEKFYVDCGSSCDGNCDACASHDMDMPFAMED